MVAQQCHKMTPHQYPSEVVSVSSPPSCFCFFSPSGLALQSHRAPCIHLTLSPQMLLTANGIVSQVHPTSSFICLFIVPMLSSTNENYLSDIMFPLSQVLQPLHNQALRVLCFLAPISVICLRNIKVSGYPYLYHSHLSLPLSHHMASILYCYQTDAGTKSGIY